MPLEEDCASVEEGTEIATYSVVCAKACPDYRTRLGHGGVGESALRGMHVSSSCDHRQHRHLSPCVLGGDDRDPFYDFPGQMGCGMAVSGSYLCESFDNPPGVVASCDCILRLRLGVVDHCHVQTSLKETASDGDHDSRLGTLPSLLNG